MSLLEDRWNIYLDAIFKSRKQKSTNKNKKLKLGVKILQIRKKNLVHYKL